MLETRRAALLDLARRARRKPVTLLYAAREERFNNAVAIKQYLGRRRG